MLRKILATIVKLVARPEFDGAFVQLVEVDAKTGCWVCVLRRGEQLRIVPEKLVQISESGQTFMKLRYTIG